MSGEAWLPSASLLYNLFHNLKEYLMRVAHTPIATHLWFDVTRVRQDFRGKPEVFYYDVHGYAHWLTLETIGL